MDRRRPQSGAFLDLFRTIILCALCVQCQEVEPGTAKLVLTQAEL